MSGIIGAAFVIITGGIDLSIGSLVCLVGVLLPYLLTVHDWPVAAGLGAVVALSIALGMIHGLLFIAFCAALTLVMIRARWPMGRGAFVFAMALIPFGPFLIDGRLKRYETEFVREA